jgi:hypothetical protein
MPGRASGTEGSLELVRAQSLHRRQAEIQQHRQADHPAPAGNRIHEASRQARGEEDRVQPECHPRTVAEAPGALKAELLLPRLKFSGRVRALCQLTTFYSRLRTR